MLQALPSCPTQCWAAATSFAAPLAAPTRRGSMWKLPGAQCSAAPLPSWRQMRTAPPMAPARRDGGLHLDGPVWLLECSHQAHREEFDMQSQKELLAAASGSLDTLRGHQWGGTPGWRWQEGRQAVASFPQMQMQTQPAVLFRIYT